MAGLTTFLLQRPGAADEYDNAVLALAVLSTVFGVGVFWRHGGAKITATGVYMFGFALFVGASRLLAVGDHRFPVDEWLWWAIVAAYSTQVLVYYLFLAHSDGRCGNAEPDVVVADPGVTRWGVGTGTVLLGTSLALMALDLPLETLLDAGAFVGALLVTSALWRRHGGGLGVFRAVVAAGAFTLYTVYVFDGFGRLSLAGLAMALALVASHRWRGRRLKALIPIATVPALVYSARSRAAFTAELNPDQTADVNGFESAIGPLVELGGLLRRAVQGEIDLAWGSTFWAAATALVPRELWAGKPIGFGAELARITSPDLVALGHSDLALLAGEFVYNFGVLGLLVMVPAIGIVLRRLDRVTVRTLHAPIDQRRDLLAVVAVAVAASGMLDMIWGGTFTYMSRSGARLAVVFLLFVLFACRRSPTKPGRRHHVSTADSVRS